MWTFSTPFNILLLNLERKALEEGLTLMIDLQT